MHREAGVALSGDSRSRSRHERCRRSWEFAALAAIGLIVREVQAADKGDLDKIADALKSGNAAVAKAGAAAYAAKHKKAGLSDLMEGFNKKELIPDGIEKKLNEFKRGGPKPADFANADYQDIGATVAAIGLVCDAFPPPNPALKNGTPRPSGKRSRPLLEKDGMAFQAAVQDEEGCRSW